MGRLVGGRRERERGGWLGRRDAGRHLFVREPVKVQGVVVHMRREPHAQCTGGRRAVAVGHIVGGVCQVGAERELVIDPADIVDDEAEELITAIVDTDPVPRALVDAQFVGLVRCETVEFTGQVSPLYVHIIEELVQLAGGGGAVVTCVAERRHAFESVGTTVRAGAGARGSGRGEERNTVDVAHRETAVSAEIDGVRVSLVC